MIECLRHVSQGNPHDAAGGDRSDIESAVDDDHALAVADYVQPVDLRWR